MLHVDPVLSRIVGTLLLVIHASSVRTVDHSISDPYDGSADVLLTADSVLNGTKVVAVPRVEVRQVTREDLSLVCQHIGVLLCSPTAGVCDDGTARSGEHEILHLVFGQVHRTGAVNQYYTSTCSHLLVEDTTLWVSKKSLNPSWVTTYVGSDSLLADSALNVES